MNSAPVSIRRLLIPLNSAMAIKARRQAPSAAASSELAGCCRDGPTGWLIRRAYHSGGREMRPDVRDWRPVQRPEQRNPPTRIRITILLVTDALGQVHGH